jgi:hypothetical protein
VVLDIRTLGVDRFTPPTFGSASHDQTFSSRIMSADTDAGGASTFAEVTADGAIVPLSVAGAATPLAIDPDMKHSHVDQYLVSLSRQAAGGLQLEGRCIHRRIGNFMGLTDTGSRYEPVTRSDPGPDGRLGTPFGRATCNSGPRFGEPLAWADPRIARAGLRVEF